ncbi:MAG TPA: cobalt ECF transporter T component CbiQ [Roseiflexaceae bacterium]|nr:cobalt ECF transporter T component CbiQ [Roseiflexaceae bacterium]
MTMQAHTLDRYQAGVSLVHRLDPRVKVIVTILFIVSNVALPDGAWLAFLLAWWLLIASSWLAGLGYGYLLRRSFVALPFALAAITAIFTIPGQPLFAWMLGSWHLTITDAGLIRFVSIVVRSWLSVQMAILLTATTQFPDLMHALRHLRVPKLLVAIVSFMYRYLFVLIDEAARLLRAREARSARSTAGAGGGSIAWRARVAGNMAGQLFLRSYERSDRVYNAMLARGYAGQFLTINPHIMRRRDWAVLLLAGVVLLIVQLVGRLPLVAL